MEIADLAWGPINDAYRKAYGPELFLLLFPDPDTRAGRNVKASIEHNPGLTLVCEEAGQVVGFCNYRFDETRMIGRVGYNAVHPDWRGRGIAQAMYCIVLEKFRQRGMRYATVHTGLDEGHAPARRAYARAGFDISHGDVDFYMEL